MAPPSHSTSRTRGQRLSVHRSCRRARLHHLAARACRRTCGRRRRHRRYRPGSDASRPGERRPGRRHRPEIDLGREAGRRPGRAVHGAPPDHRQRRATPRASRRVPGRGRSSPGEAPESTPSCSTTSRPGRQRPSAGTIDGRTATIRAPISGLGGQTNGTLGRVQAYFRAEPVGGRSGATDRAASSGPTIWFCLTDRRPRPKWGPCIWPGQVR